ncbi:HAD-IA family hydrolase, partial [Streptomyces edwardsiae]
QENRTARAVGGGAGFPVVREGRGGTVVAVGPMLDNVLAATEGLDVNVLYATTVRPFDAAGLRRAVVSSSANTEEVLKITGLDTYIEQRVDGVTMRDENLPGKPAPDSFLRAAELLGVSPAQAAVYEDALAGVAAGR